MEVSYLLCYFLFARHLATMHSATVNIIIHVSFYISAFISLVHLPLCGIAGAKCMCIAFLVNIAKLFVNKIVSVPELLLPCF